MLDIAEQGSEFPFPLYPRVGHFVAYLVGVHGETVLRELSLETNFESSLEAFRGAVLDVYGQELEALVEDYEASYPECPQIDYRAAFGECAFTPARPICEDGGPLVVRRRFSLLVR